MSIPGWFDWEALYEESVARATDGAHFVECGTFFGKSADFLARAILASGKRIQFETWDNWLGVPPGFGYPGWTGSGWPHVDLVRRTLAGLPVTVRTGDAVEAAAEYADGSLDLVFLDDDHASEHVAVECAAWWPKVRPGGTLAGHDYDWPSVHEAVTRWATTAGVTVTPTCTRSWLAVKP